MWRGAEPDLSNHSCNFEGADINLWTISRCDHARGLERIVCLHWRQTRPSINGAFHSKSACFSNITPNTSPGSTSFMQRATDALVMVLLSGSEAVAVERQGAKFTLKLEKPERPDYSRFIYYLTTWQTRTIKRRCVTKS